MVVVLESEETCVRFTLAPVRYVFFFLLFSGVSKSSQCIEVMCSSFEGTKPVQNPEAQIEHVDLLSYLCQASLLHLPYLVDCSIRRFFHSIFHMLNISCIVDQFVTTGRLSTTGTPELNAERINISHRSSYHCAVIIRIAQKHSAVRAQERKLFPSSQ